MTFFIGGATLATGGLSAYSANKASKRASKAQGKATDATIDLEEQKLDFAYEQYDEQLAQYDEWKAIYGPVEENLGEFYNSLTPETFEAAGLEYNQAEFQKAKTQTFETLAQRGLDSSGLLASTESRMNIKNAETKAGIRRDAKFKVADEKSKFLSAGKGGPVQPPTGNVGNVLAGSRTAGAYQNEANIAAGNANSLWNSAGDLLSSGVGYLARNANNGAPKVDKA